MTEMIATAQARAERIRAGAEQAKAWIEDVMQAAVEGDWKTLGYGSWQDYCDDVIGERVQLPRGERQEIVGRMREAGMSTRAIGAALGVSHMTAERDAEAGVTNVTPDPEPRPVAGLDGKTYTQPPRPAPIPAQEATPEPGAADDPPSQQLRPDELDGLLSSGLIQDEGDLHQALGPFDEDDESEAVQGETVDNSEPMPQPSPEALKRYKAERDEQTSREVASKNLARSVWMLAQFATTADEVEFFLEDWQPSQDIFPRPTTAERMRAAADFLYELAERWPQ